MLTSKPVALCSCLPKVLPATSLLSSIRHKTDDVSFLVDHNPATFPKGPGGRSSFSGKVVTIFGASGFLGMHTTSHLAKFGTQVVVPFRDFFFTKQLRGIGDLGQLVYTQFSLKDDNSIRKAMMYSDTVINLIGQNAAQVPCLFEKINVDCARKIAKCSREMGVPHLIHVSALNSNIQTEGFWRKTGSEFMRTKSLGEQAVKEEFPLATIIRPSDMFGDADLFFSSLLTTMRVGNWKIPIPHAGKGIFKQPVSVVNVAHAIAYAAMNEKKTAGITYEAIGPRRYEFCDLMDYLHRVIRRDEMYGYKVTDAKYSLRLYLKMWLNEKCPIELFPRRHFCIDRIEREALTDTTCGLPTLGDMLDMRLVTIEEVAEMILKNFRVGRYHSQSINEAYIESPAAFKEMKC